MTRELDARHGQAQPADDLLSGDRCVQIVSDECVNIGGQILYQLSHKRPSRARDACGRTPMGPVRVDRRQRAAICSINGTPPRENMGRKNIRG